MNLAKAVTLVTGANRGLGRSLVNALIDAGAPRIYGGSRNLSNLPRYGSTAAVLPLELDITAFSQVSRAAFLASDVTLLINNAGLLPRGSAMSMSEEDLREAIEVNLIGTWRMARTFAPIIEANGGGAVVNVLSLLSLHNEPSFAAYCAAKYASWAMTQSLREELAGTRVRVVACFPGGIDTDMLAGVPAIKASADQVAVEIVTAIRRGDSEIFPDPVSMRRGPALLGNERLSTHL